MFNRARYYNPTWGRFISEDPIGVDGGSNLYGYARQAPSIFTDRLGMDPLSSRDLRFLIDILGLALSLTTFVVLPEAGYFLAGEYEFEIQLLTDLTEAANLGVSFGDFLHTMTDPGASGRDKVLAVLTFGLSVVPIKGMDVLTAGYQYDADFGS